MLLSATAEGLGAEFHIPVGDEAARIKALVNAPEHYELTCLLTLGYVADNAFLPRQKAIDPLTRIHRGSW